MDVVAPAEADRLDRLERGEHAVGADRHAGVAQDAREVDDVVGEHRPASPRARLAARGRLQLVEQLGDVAALHLGDVVAVLEQHAERVADVVGREADRVQRDQRVGPVDRLGDAGRLEEVERAHPLHEGDDLRVRALGRARARGCGTISSSRSSVRVVDPVVQAAALQRVVDLARAVAGDDDDRRRRGAAPCRARGWSAGSRPGTSSRKASKGSSARSSSSISSTGERCLRQRLQQRPLDQHVARVAGSREALARGGVADVVRRLGERGSPSSGARRSTRRRSARRRGPRSTARAAASRCSARASALASSVLPTPGSPSSEERALQLQREEDRGREAPVGDVVSAASSGETSSTERAVRRAAGEITMHSRRRHPGRSEAIWRSARSFAPPG